MEAQEEVLRRQQRELPCMQLGGFRRNVCKPSKVGVLEDLDADVRQRSDVQRLGHRIVLTTLAAGPRVQADDWF